MSPTSAPTLLFPVKLRLTPPGGLFTRRFEAQLHWCPAYDDLVHGFRSAAPGGQGATTENTECI
jgi:hypothetical protein